MGRTPKILSRKLVIKLYNCGMTQKEIGKYFGVTAESICIFMKKNNIKVRKREISISKELVIKLYNSGMSQVKIGKLLGIADNTISKFMKKNNISVRIPTYQRKNEESPHWSDATISYAGAHQRIRRIRGEPKECVECGVTDKKLEWANINKKYHDPYDYQAMCISCHRKWDADKRKERSNEQIKDEG